MHVLTTTISSFPLILNVNTSVGRGGQNSNIEDILLVQFLLRKLVERMPATTPAGKAADEVMRRIQFTGAADPTTIAAIEAFQQSQRAAVSGTIVDGKVSPAHGIAYGGGAWTIAQLNFFIRKSCQDVWPRLDKFGDCPGLLKSRIPQIL
jgi:hypothetical protein